VTEVLYSALGPDGVNLLMDADDDGEVTRQDIGLTLETGAGGIISGVLFNLPLGRRGQLLSESIAFDIGLPGLGLEVDGDVKLEADFSFDLGIGLSLADGVYIDTSSDHELSISITATTPGLSAKGTLGFLQLDVADDAADPTHVGASFTVDLRDLNDDNRLTLSEMYRGSASQLLGATLEAGVGVNLDLMASFSGNANFPRIRTDFVFDWGYSQSFGASATGTHSSPSTSPTVRFDNVELSLGEFINQFLGPIVDKVQTITKPVQPILDALNSKVPMVSQIMGGVTWLDLAAMFGGAEVKPFAEALGIIDQIIDVVDQLKGTGNDLWINLGSFTILGEDATNPEMAGHVSSSGHTPSVASLAEQLESKGAKALNDKVLTGEAQKIIQFPLLDHPTNAFQLLLGHDVDLVVFDLPELEMGFNLAYRMRFPPFPVLYAEVGGGASAKISFDFGYDTAGLRKFVRTLDPLDIAEGFYISDRANANGTGPDIPEATFTGRIYVQGGLDAGIFEAGVRGQLTATVDFNLHDYPDEFSNQTDGKIRFDEMLRSVVLTPPPIHLFDIGGSIDAGLSAFLKIDLGLFTIKKSFKIASVHLLDFKVPRPAENRPLLATKSGTTLTLNMTPGADHYVVLPGTDPNDSNRVVVRGFRADGSVIDTRGFSNITRIVALGSDGDDIIEIDGKLNQAVELHGGAGNDRLVAGSGIAVLYGDAGNDILIGGRSADTLDGGDDNDTITGNAGNDIIRGGAGVDVIHGNEGNDTIDGGDGNDQIFGDVGNDTITAGGGDDQVWGDVGNDVIRGGDGNDTIYGEEGNDTIFGDAGNDVIVGANGRDYIDGGADEDDIDGGLMSDFIIGGSGNDRIDGGAAVDTIYGNAVGTIQLMPGLFNDTGSGNNVIIGGSGTDLISTGTGNDTVYSGSWVGNGATYVPREDLVQYIHAAGGDNEIHGDLGDDIIVTGPGLDTIFGYQGDDVILSGAGNDVIDAGDGDDLVVSEFGHDTVSGGKGRDIIWGGLLPQPLSGIDPTSTTFAGKLPQIVAAFNGSLQARVAAWVHDGVKPPDWDSAEASNATGFAVPEIMPRGMNGLSLEGTPLDGNDTIDAGDDDDHVFGGSDQDILRGGSGNDFIDGGAGNDFIRGGSGDDALRGGGDRL
ncbi:MAG: hypothetical protein KDA89_20055, partial [Planctomycetaceae bacterium]|nr:hypothetical protein [Planctomycetaceae bacterium]